MTAWNFQKRFATDVAAGVKRSTIRARRADGRDPKVGDRRAFFTGMRTIHCRRLGDGVIRERMGIAIDPPGVVHLAERPLDFREILDQEILELAREDGFDGVEAFLAFIEKTHGFPFEGYLYRW